MLKSRILTACIAVPIVILLIWFLPPFMFSVLMALVVAYAAWEWSSLVGYPYLAMRIVYVVAILFALFLTILIPALPILLVGLAALIWILIAIVHYQRGGAGFGLQSAALRAAFGFFLLVPFWVAIVVLRANILFGVGWVLYLLVIVWSADTLAYFFGKHYGTAKLASRVSPNKTWIGFAAGVVGALIIAICLSFAFTISMPERALLWGAALIAILFSVLGDLSISLLKRITDVKDTGALFPGHGGMLDRLDAVIAATIVFVLAAALI